MLGDNIKALRKKKGYSQETLAQELFVVRQTISKWEKGLSVPDAEMLEKLADVLEISVNELLDKEVVNEEKTDNNNEVARQLAILNEQIANRTRRNKRILKIVLIGVLVIFVIIPIICATLFSSVKSTGSSTTNAAVYIIDEWDDQGETTYYGNTML